MSMHAGYVTPEGLTQLEEELAKQGQAFVEGRILELEHMSAQAKLIEPGGSKDVVKIGSTVVVQEGGNKPETYTIVGAAEANPKQGVISNEPPHPHAHPAP